MPNNHNINPQTYFFIVGLMLTHETGAAAFQIIQTGQEAVRNLVAHGGSYILTRAATSAAPIVVAQTVWPFFQDQETLSQFVTSAPDPHSMWVRGASVLIIYSATGILAGINGELAGQSGVLLATFVQFMASANQCIFIVKSSVPFKYKVVYMIVGPVIKIIVLRIVRTYIRVLKRSMSLGLKIGRRARSRVLSVARKVKNIRSPFGLRSRITNILLKKSRYKN